MPRLCACSSVAVVCLAVAGCADGQSSIPAAAQSIPLSVRSSLDRTAAWVGDPVTYTVEIVCAPGYDVSEDDLARDRLPLEGLEVRAADTAREAREDGTVLHRARFQLASYTPERGSLRVGPMTVHYYRRESDGRVVSRLPVGSVEVPAEEIALRSTVPDSAGAAVIRTAISPALLPRSVRVLYPLGLALVALPFLAIGGRFAAAALARRQPPAQTQAPVVDQPTRYRLAFDEIRRLHDDADSQAIRHAFGRLDRLVREFLAGEGIDAKSLTPDEIESRVGAAGNTTPHRAAAGVLRECERARYAGPNQPPTRDRLAHAIDEAAALVPTQGDAP